MPSNPQNPLVIQSDRTVLLEVQNDFYEAARDALARFAELEKSPEYLHTYRLTPLSLWNAAAAGLTAAEIIASLEQFAKYDLPGNVRAEIIEQVGRYGRIRLYRQEADLLLHSDDAALIAEIARHKTVAPFIKSQPDAHTLLAGGAQRQDKVRLLHQSPCTKKTSVPRGERLLAIRLVIFQSGPPVGSPAKPWSKGCRTWYRFS